MIRPVCPTCSKLIVLPAGNPRSRILLVGSEPSWEEIRDGIPLSGGIGNILNIELNRVGMSYYDCRRTNLWQHGLDVKECNVEIHLNKLVKEFKNKTHVLLMGSDVISALLGRKVSELYGLRVNIPDFKTVHFWVSPSPAVAFHSAIGDLRLSLERFAKDVGHKNQ